MSKKDKKDKRAAREAAERDAARVTEPPPAGPVPTPKARDAGVPTVDVGRFGFGIARAVDALGGARLCYGEPVELEGRTVIPVARVRGAIGYGFGRGRQEGGAENGDGGGAGGAVEATPAGFLDITKDGVRYEPIPDPVTTARALGTGASALAMLVSALLGVRRLARGRKAAGLLPPKA